VGLDLLQDDEEVELVTSLADSADEDEPRRPLSLELLPVGSELRSTRALRWHAGKL
jgi:hypothetical protein